MIASSFSYLSYHDMFIIWGGRQEGIMAVIGLNMGILYVFVINTVQSLIGFYVIIF